MPAAARPLRILQVFNRYLRPGGEEKSVARIAQDLEDGGHQVTRWWRASAEWQGEQGPPRWQRPLLLWRNRAVLRELAAVHQQTQPDLWLLHNVLPVISLGVYGLARRLGVPVIQWLHNYRPISPSGTLFARARSLAPEDRWRTWREVRAGAWHGPFPTAWLALGYDRARRRGDFEGVRGWVAISEEMKKVFLRAGWFPDRLYALRHSWHIQAPAPSPAERPYFLFLGRMVEAKGVRFLADLWNRPGLKDVSLVMAGQGELADELRGRTPPQVTWAGQTDGEAKRRWLAECRAVVVPGLWEEPLGLVAYEAFEAGKPVLASSLGGLREIVQDGVTGRLLPAGDARAWEEALLVLDAAKARELGRAGRKWLETHTSPALWQNGFLDIVGRAVPGLR
jgi:glycosyltransferase involved in cell wall biosynthesis